MNGNVYDFLYHIKLDMLIITVIFWKLKNWKNTFKLKINLENLRKILLNQKELKNFVHKNKKEKKIIHLYGASTKGNIILQYCRLTKKDIEFAADRNSEKWGRETPGSKIPIISETSSRIKKPDFYLVMPWHFKKEILKREKIFLKHGGKLVFPLPKLNIVSKWIKLVGVS